MFPINFHSASVKNSVAGIKTLGVSVTTPKGAYAVTGFTGWVMIMMVASANRLTVGTPAVYGAKTGGITMGTGGVKGKGR